MLEFGDVGTSGEGLLPSPRQDQDPDFLVRLGLVRHPGKLLDHHLINRIKRLGTIQGDEGDPIGDLVAQRLMVHNLFLSLVFICVKTAALLLAEEASFDHADQERTGTVFGFPKTLVKGLQDGEADVEADQISQG